MKRKNWTHDVRHANYLLIRDLSYLAAMTGPAYSNRTAEEEDRIWIEMQRLRAQLSAIRGAASNTYWARVNLRWSALRQRLQNYKVRSSALRALEQIKAAREAKA